MVLCLMLFPKKKQCVPKAIFPAGVIVGLRVQSSFGNRSKGRSRLDPIGPDGELVIGPLILGSGRVGRRGAVVEEKNLLASKRSFLLLPFTPADHSLQD